MYVTLFLSLYIHTLVEDVGFVAGRKLIINGNRLLSLYLQPFHQN